MVGAAYAALTCCSRPSLRPAPIPPFGACEPAVFPAAYGPGAVLAAHWQYHSAAVAGYICGSAATLPPACAQPALGVLGGENGGAGSGRDAWRYKSVFPVFGHAFGPVSCPFYERSRRGCRYGIFSRRQLLGGLSTHRCSCFGEAAVMRLLGLPLMGLYLILPALAKIYRYYSWIPFRLQGGKCIRSESGDSAAGMARVCCLDQNHAQGIAASRLQPELQYIVEEPWIPGGRHLISTAG
jgi:hypothetical protein